ncbi:hypothetical protein BKK54_10585 [Rodentibacter genomosp. 1]|uniref:Porin domain-containing protein n=1 Tax=Rodentibacter genomosp. 1 TaxID=1908264 RepID=A0A1V3J1G1_9PAST|nr:porin [Rodentibacter genomosp. 1]OOF48668.1 hypothetical protein BKK54_10585 [Rodentibacter genomosp. 1]
MKKTLAALIVGAFAASAANAAVIYDNEGTKVELNGSLRILLEKSNQGGENNKHSHSGLKNSGSRVEVRVKHDLSEGYYALGRVEVRFDGKQGGTVREDGFGNLNTKRAYVGLGHKDLGELTFGRQVTIADDLSTADDYAYGIINKGDYIPTEGNSIVRYDYRGIENLQLGVGYQFADNRDTNNEVSLGNVKSGFQLGAVYNGKWDDVSGVIAKFGYGRTNYKTNSNQKHYQDGFLASLGYNYADLLVSVDGGYAKAKQDGQDTKKYFVSPGFQYQVIDNSKIYGNYKYEQSKTGANKSKTHGFLLGVDYKLHKQVVTFVEGKYVVTKDYVNGNYVDNSKVTDKAIGVGMRVYF